MKDKKNKLKNMKNNSIIRIELGCGNSRKFLDSITIDKVDLDSVDIVADINYGLKFIPNDSIDEVYSSHFLEHVDNYELVMSEIFRILKPGGKKIGTVPHFSNPHFYSDYTHKNYFGLYTFFYMSKTSTMKRKVPNYYNNINFNVLQLRLIFFSSYRLLHYARKIIERIFNINNSMKEFYEENLCYMIPANEIFFILEKSKEGD